VDYQRSQITIDFLLAPQVIHKKILQCQTSNTFSPLHWHSQGWYRKRRKEEKSVSQTNIKHLNNLARYRKRMGFTQERVAQLLGYKTRDAISRMEMGYSLPRLYTALQFAALYRIPVDFLYHEKYIALRDEIRKGEGTSRAPSQGVLAFAAL
jgi:DNA-binding XRE family transcriptional regulator